MTDAIDIDLLGHSQHHINHELLGVLRAQQAELDSLHAQVAHLRNAQRSTLALIDLCAIELGLVTREEVQDNIDAVRAVSHPQPSSDQSDETWEEVLAREHPEL